MTKRVTKRELRAGVKRAMAAARVQASALNEIWWIAVAPSNAPIWPYLELRRKDVVECLQRDYPDWLSKGWRIAKLQVAEILPRRGAR